MATDISKEREGILFYSYYSLPAWFWRYIRYYPSKQEYFFTHLYDVTCHNIWIFMVQT